MFEYHSLLLFHLVDLFLYCLVWRLEEVGGEPWRRETGRDRDWKLSCICLYQKEKMFESEMCRLVTVGAINSFVALDATLLLPSTLKVIN